MKKKDIYSIAYSLKIAKDNAEKASNEFNEMHKDVIESIESINARFEESRLSLIDEYCQKNEDGTPAVRDNQYIIPEEKMDEFNEKMEKIKINSEIEFNAELEKEV